MYVMFTFVVYALAYIWRMRTYRKKKRKNECFPLMNII